MITKTVLTPENNFLKSSGEMLKFFLEYSNVNNLSSLVSPGHSNLINEQQTLTLGINAFLLKPLTLNELGKAVRHCLREHNLICPLETSEQN